MLLLSPRARAPFLLSSGLLLLCALNASAQNRVQAPSSAAQTPAPGSAWNEPLSGPPAALHVLNRLAFGPRPGDIADVERAGIRAWIETQLRPGSIDDRALETKVAALDLLGSSPERLALIYAGDDGPLRRYQMMQSRGMNQMMTAAPGAAAPGAAAPKTKKARTLNERQLQILADFQAAGLRPGVSTQVAAQLVEDKLVRAVESKRQLQETLADFWSNHFNIDMRKNAGRVLKVLDDRQTIRPHLFGSFRELLGASAHSPAMLVYLDNARSSKQMSNRKGKTRGGLNENYARELMELHTLGVDGGYTQSDVTEVARCLTGWGLRPGSGQFQFHGRLHDEGEKTVLGQRIAAGGGQNDGEQVLDILASSPATAHFLARELCQRFVADEPPPALVERVAQTFLKTKGDLPSVYKSIFLSREFLSKGAYRAKIKSPFELAVSSVRALGGQLSVPDGRSPAEAGRLLRIGAASAQQNTGKKAKNRRGGRTLLALQIADLGQPIFACLPPTGWSEDSRGWVSAGAIVGRLNFALALTSGQIGDVRLQSDTFRPVPIDTLSQELVGGQLSAATRATIAKETATAPDPAKTRALILGSPEFQRR
jgi:uncharacterized protein (DUF1800 family)